MSPSQYLAFYLPLVAMLASGLYHQTSTDGDASLFAHFGWTYRLPAKATPLVVLGLGLGSGILDAKVGGADWAHAAFTGFNATLSSVFGAGMSHALTGMALPKGTPLQGDFLTTVKPANDSKPPSTPPKGPGPLAGAAVLLAIIGCLGVLAGNTSCKDPNVPVIVNDALTATQIFCVESSQFTDSQAVADACAIDTALVPIIEQLLAQKAAAAKQGFAWDAGAGDAAAPAKASKK